MGTTRSNIPSYRRWIDAVLSQNPLDRAPSDLATQVPHGPLDSSIAHPSFSRAILSTNSTMLSAFRGRLPTDSNLRSGSA
jgi:hypothetical protein